MARADYVGSEYGLDRLTAGIQTTSKAIRMLLYRNDLTHDELVKLSRWCNPWGETWLSTSQVSYLRTAGLKKAGPQTLDALGQLNLRLAQAAGDKSPLVLALPDFGPMPSSPRLPEEPFFLRHAESKEPLDAGALYLMWLGRLVPEGLEADGHISDMEARKLSAVISSIVQGWARDKNLTIGQAMDRSLAFYEVDEKRRQNRLKAVVVGFEVFTGEELSEELADLGKLLGGLDGSGPIAAGDVRERLYRSPKE